MTVTTVWGPAGSPGRTSLSIALAAECALLGRRVILLDCDSYGGAVATTLDVFDEISGVLSLCRRASKGELSPDVLEQQLHRMSTPRGQLRILSGLTNTARWPELSSTRLSELIALCSEICDEVIIDVGFNLDEDEEVSSDMFAPRRNAATITALQTSDRILAIARADVVGLSRFLRTYSQLRELAPEKPIDVIANRVRSRALGLGPAAAVRGTLSRFAGITEVTIIPEDAAAFDQAMLESKPLGFVAPRSPARKALRALAAELFGSPLTVGQRDASAQRG